MNAYGVVEQFEERMAAFAGAKYGVAVDCCTSAIFLCCKYKSVGLVELPARTYISVPAAVIHAGGRVRFVDYDWRGIYQIAPYPIFDGAKRYMRGMYAGGLHCLSFHLKKHVAIGRGGMVLTDDEQAAKWLRKARYDGREGKPYAEERVDMLGYHVYMQPPQAARGLELMDMLPEAMPDLTEDYPDLRDMPVFMGPVKMELLVA